MDYSIQLKAAKTKICISSFRIFLQIMVAMSGFEPLTNALWRHCTNHCATSPLYGAEGGWWSHYLLLTKQLLFQRELLRHYWNESHLLIWISRQICADCIKPTFRMVLVVGFEPTLNTPWTCRLLPLGYTSWLLLLGSNQLSLGQSQVHCQLCEGAIVWYQWMDLDHRPLPCQGSALTNWATLIGRINGIRTHTN